MENSVENQDNIENETINQTPPLSPEKTQCKEKPQAPKTKKSKNGCIWWGVGIFAMIFIIGCGIMFIAILISMASSGSSSGLSTLTKNSTFTEEFESGSRFASNKIAVINITGIITNADAGWSNSIANSDFICAQVKAAADDNAVKAIILRLNTPGGEVTAADNIYHQIIKLRNETSKPVIASMGSVAASGGVYIAVAADYIIANKLTTTGSIGVIAQTYNYVDLFKKVGLKAETYTSGPMKDLLNGARPRTEEEIEIIQEIIDEVYSDFVKIVAEGRPKLTEKKIRETVVGDGRIFSGKQALKYGLVDALGYYEDAVNKAAAMASLPKDNYQVVRYSRRISFLDIFKMQGGDTKIKVELPGSPLKSEMPANGKFFFLPAW